jgi:DHA2 family multidrug resistance protein
LLISIGIGGLQYVLDRGNVDDWFNSTSICVVTYLTITGFLGFIFHNMQPRTHHVFDLAIFKDRNFAIASTLLCVFGLGLYGTMVILPLMMEGLFNYPVLTAGLVMAPRGISGMISMILVGKLIKYIDPRHIILFGLLLGILGTWLCTFYSLDIDISWFIWPMVLQGFGLGMIFVPLATIAFSTLQPALRTEAAGLYSLLRTIGGSIGISITITIYARRSQLFWNELGGGITQYNPAVFDYLNKLHLHPDQPMAIALLTSELGKQASMIAFVNAFTFILCCFCLMIPLALFLKKGKKTPSTI